jgi:hypothetical protein
VLTFFIAGLLYLLRFKRVDNLGAYSIPSETGLLIPSVCNIFAQRLGSCQKVQSARDPLLGVNVLIGIAPTRKSHIPPGIVFGAETRSSSLQHRCYTPLSGWTMANFFVPSYESDTAHAEDAASDADIYELAIEKGKGARFGIWGGGPDGRPLSIKVYRNSTIVSDGANAPVKLTRPAARRSDFWCSS